MSSPISSADNINYDALISKYYPDQSTKINILKAARAGCLLTAGAILAGDVYQIYQNPSLLNSLNPWSDQFQFPTYSIENFQNNLTLRNITFVTACMVEGVLALAIKNLEAQKSSRENLLKHVEQAALTEISTRKIQELARTVKG